MNFDETSTPSVPGKRFRSELHQRELMLNWLHLRYDQPIKRIEPLRSRDQAIFPRVKQVLHLGGVPFETEFYGWHEGELDLETRILGRGGVFRPLEFIDYFRQVRVDTEAGTIMWRNEVHFCPDVLYSLVTGTPIRALEMV